MMVTDLLRRGVPWTALVLDRGPAAARLNLRGRHLAAAGAFTASLGAVAVRRPRVAGPLGLGYLLLNSRFYLLLLRCAGPRSAAAGVGLLAAHNVAALGSAPLGAVSFGVERASTWRSRWRRARVSPPAHLTSRRHDGRLSPQIVAPEGEPTVWGGRIRSVA